MRRATSFGIAVLVVSTVALFAGPGFGVPCVPEQEDNGSMGSADNLGGIPGSGCRAGMIYPSGDVDLYAFTVSATSRVVLETITDGDTVLRLYDSSGALVAENDDWGTERASRIVHELPAGIYFAGVAAYQGTIGEYEIHIEGEASGSSSCPREQESNDTMSLADSLCGIPGSGCRSGAIQPAGDVDLYAFTVSATSRIVIETVTDGDTILRLYDSSNALIAEDDDGGSGRASRIVVELPSGAYLAAVSSYEGSAIRSYEIRAQGEPLHSTQCPHEQEDNRDFGSADSLGGVPGSGCRSGAISPSGDVDMYWVTVTQTCHVVIETITDGDTILRLYNSSGELIAEDDDGGSASASRLTGTISPGSYGVAVVGYQGGTVRSYEIHIVGEVRAGDATPSTNPPASDAPPWGWSIVGDGILLSAWGRLDEDCPSDYALGQGQCDKDTYDLTVGSAGYVSLGLIDEDGQWITAHLYDASGRRILSKLGQAVSIYSSWVEVPPGTYRVEVVPGKRLDKSSYELHAFYSPSRQDEAYLIGRYGPAEREL